jgi:c-di-GMP-binding flagellar brake protein YcgR
MSHSKSIPKATNSVKEQRRKSVRVQISSEVKFKIYSGYQQNFQNGVHNARMLNISEGGTLLVSKQYVPEGSFVSLALKLRGIENLEDILGKVKRVDQGGNEEFLIGVEFCKAGKDSSASSQKKQKNPQISDFSEKLKRALTKHLHP